jgi:glycosyltransferase involved in cell wall biosynthesis
MTIHVMHVIETLRLGGAERTLVDLANATVAEGNRVSVCLIGDGRDLANELRPEIPLFVLARRGSFDRAALKRWASIIHEQKVDLLHVHGRSVFAFAATGRTLGLFSTPILLHDHHGQIEIDASVPLWFRLWGRRYVERYVGVYSKLADWAEAGGVPRSRTCAINDAVDLARMQNAQPGDLRSEFGIAEGDRIGLTVCGLRREKGIMTLLDAVARLSGRHALKVIVVGRETEKGHLAACKAQAFSLGLSDTVIFAGERADVPALIKGADFAVVPSLSESGPLVLIEYMAGGLPFVAALVGDIAHRVDKFGGSQFVPPGDPTALAEAMSHLLSLAPADWETRREASRRIAAENFDIRQTLPRWYRMYRESLKLITP